MRSVRPPIERTAVAGSEGSLIDVDHVVQVTVKVRVVASHRAPPRAVVIMVPDFVP